MSRFQRPRIVAVEHPNAPVALAGGRTALRVVLEGSGALVIDGQRLPFTNGFDRVVMVRVAPVVPIRVVRAFPLGFLVGDARDIRLSPLAPAPVDVEVHVEPPPAPSPRVALPTDVRPPAPRFSPRALSPSADDFRTHSRTDSSTDSRTDSSTDSQTLAVRKR